MVKLNKSNKFRYLDNLNIDQVSIAAGKKRKGGVFHQIPPYNGYGTLEDSIGSVYALDPKPPKKNEKKFYKSDIHVLRFDAKLLSTEPDDENRKFIVAFFWGDDTIEVFEVWDRNSGRIGGKFLERKKHKHPAYPHRYYVEKDFRIGESAFLGGHKFQLNNCDEYTHKYMEDNFDVFPEASLDKVVEKIRTGALSYPSLQDYAISLIQRLDKNGDEIISFDEFRDGMSEVGIHLTEHEINTLLRAFDHNKDGRLSVEEFYNALAESVNNELDK